MLARLLRSRRRRRGDTFAGIRTIGQAFTYVSPQRTPRGSRFRPYDPAVATACAYLVLHLARGRRRGAPPTTPDELALTLARREPETLIGELTRSPARDVRRYIADMGRHETTRGILREPRDAAEAIKLQEQLAALFAEVRRQYAGRE